MPKTTGDIIDDNVAGDYLAAYYEDNENQLWWSEEERTLEFVKLLTMCSVEEVTKKDIETVLQRMIKVKE